MKFTRNKAALAAVALLAFAPSASAHSWIEYAKKLAKNGTMVGAYGYPRGYIPRNSTDPVYTDTIPQNILPVSGQSAYSGDEILNKYKYDADPEYPMLEASAGDYIAVMHLENGHTTLPQNQPKKPLNRGTLYFYGTSEPAASEKLFDVHLLWNANGTGGDKRGRLLATRNYDDGQCYQTNSGVISTERAAKYASQGAKHDEELACQSDIKLPDDLAEGSVYTIYWYWDWPDLNSDKINISATTDGKFPWAGTFMRGLKDPNGFTMDAIAKNESYSSVMDIKITGSNSSSFSAKGASVAADYVQDQNIYSVGIEEQMKSNYQVDVADGGSNAGDDAGSTTTTTGTPVATTPASVPATTPAVGSTSSIAGAVTVTVTETYTPPASVTTVYVTVPADQITTTSQPATADDALSTSTQYITLTTHINQTPAAQSTSTYIKTITTHVNRAQATSIPGGSFQESDAEEAVSSSSVVPGGSFRESAVSDGGVDASASSTTTAPIVTQTPYRRRANWALGAY